MRKIRLGAVLAACLLATHGAHGAAMGMGGIGPAAPYKPYRTVNLGPRYDHVVIEAMVYECPYCRQLNDPTLQWAKTLPAGIHFAQMPAVVGQNWIPMGQAYFSVAAMDPQALQSFDDEAFGMVQDQHESFSDPRTYAQAAKDIGLNIRSYIQAAGDPEVHKLVLDDIKIMARAKIRQTPSLIICGKYVITPGSVQGNYGMYFEMANALVSRCLTENRMEHP